MYRDFKYLLAYTLPLSAFLGFYLGGIWSFGCTYVAFVVLPILELLLPSSTENVAEHEESNRSSLRFFDYLLYLNLPLLYIGVGLFIYQVGYGQPSTFEYTGYIFNLGTLIGTIGINVGHELGHRYNLTEKLIAQGLLLPGLYQHFQIEHNHGHHKHVATPADPASARSGESLYFFWFRSVIGQWRNAWQIQAKQMRAKGQNPLSWRNLMARFQLMNILYIVGAWYFFGQAVGLGLLAAGIAGFLLLETVNYIEHYGLSRKKLASGRYEPVSPVHSWNSNHEMGRIFLYELTRHSDHHFKATRKYQILRSHDVSPTLPTGYPGCMLMALVPPVWFWVVHKQMNKEVIGV
ncbi:MAG: alkane 1-monooxygenase [Bacteroidota bacterium]